MILSALDQGRAPQNSASCTSKTKQPTRQSPHQPGGSPEPSSVRQAWQATTAPQRLCCTSQPCSRKELLQEKAVCSSKDAKRRVFIAGEGLCSGRADVPPEEVTGSHQPRPLRQGKDALADFCCGDSTAWGHPGERGDICLRKVR